MRVVALLFAVLLVAAAPANEAQRGMAALQALDARVTAVGHRLAVAGVGLCPDHGRRAGFTIQGISQYPPPARADAAALFGLRDAPVVLAVAPGGSAARAGLRVGDTIVAIEDVAVSTSAGKTADYAPVEAVERRIEDALARGALTLTAERQDQRSEIVVRGDDGCRSRFQVIPDSRLNASADGTYVQLSSRVAELARSDDELALVIAHELAHNILRHRDALDAAGVSRGLLRAFGKNRTRIRATEVAADRFALYLMARAGYDIGVAPGFWDRFGRLTGYGIFADGTHAGRIDRITAAQREIAIIRGQQAAGQAPTPR